MDYVAQSENLAGIFPWHFTRPADYLSQAQNLSQRDYRRDVLCEILQEQNQQFEAPASTFARIKQLRQPDCQVIITGQQVGLFAGPLYTFYKALTTIKVAQQLVGQLQRPIVPVFWMASDDHDLEEATSIYICDPNNEMQRLEMTLQESDRRLPISKLTVKTAIKSLLERLSSSLPESEFLPALLARLQQAYQPGTAFPLAFARWLQFILRQYGLILVDPADHRLKQLAQSLFRREIQERSPVTRAVIVQNEQLIKSGYALQLELHAGVLNLFYHTPQREAIFFAKDQFYLKQKQLRFSESELLQLLAAEPENFSPNAALRSLYQDTLFPTLASVLGPAELAYFAQLSGAYALMNIPMPIAFPRPSVTLLEPRIDRILHKQDLQIQDVFREKEKLIDKVIKRKIPDTLVIDLKDRRSKVAKIWWSLQQELSRFDANLTKPAEIAAGRSLNQFDFMTKKLLQATRQKNEVVQKQMEKLLVALLPLSSPQERIYNLLPFYARYGQQFVDTVFSSLEVFNPDHQVIKLGTKQQE